MRNDVKISGIQMALIFIGFFVGSTALLNPSVAARQDAWLSNILACAGEFILITLYIYISVLNPDKTLIEILRDNFGRFFGGLISLLYIWYFIHLAALVERDLGEFNVTTTYVETPMLFIIICIVTITVFIVKKGLEVLARTSEILVPVIISLIIFIFILLISLYEVENFFPVLERGFKPVLRSAFTVLTFPWGESVIFLMIFHNLNNKKKIFKVSFLSVAISGLLILLITTRDLMVLGGDMFERVAFPPNMTTKLIENINVTPLVDVNLLIGGGTKIAVCIYAAALGIAQLLNLKDYKPFVLPVAAISVAVALWDFENLMDVIRWGVEVWPLYCVPFQIIIPLLLLIVSLIRRKSRKAAPKTCEKKYRAKWSYQKSAK